MSNISWNTEKTKKKEIVKGLKPIQVVQDFEIQKMIDFASSYFFTKSQVMPLNLISIYKFEDQALSQLFKQNKQKQDLVFSKFINKQADRIKNPYVYHQGSQNQSVEESNQSISILNSSRSVKTKQNEANNQNEISNLIKKQKQQEISKLKIPQTQSRQFDDLSKSLSKNSNRSGTYKSLKDSQISQKSFQQSVQSILNSSHLSQKSKKSISSFHPSQQFNSSENIQQSPERIIEIKQPNSNSFKKKNNNIDQNQANFNFKSSSTKKTTVKKPQPEPEHLVQSQDSNQLFDQFSDYVQSQASFKIQKLQDIQQQDQNQSTIRISENPLSMNKQISNFSHKQKHSSKQKQQIKTLLQLQRIQISIKQLQDQFQQLLAYELKFPKQQIKLSSMSVQKSIKIKKLSKVFDIDY